jgi:hypothetical protein
MSGAHRRIAHAETKADKAFRLNRWGQSEMFRALCLRLGGEQDASNSN